MADEFPQGMRLTAVLHTQPKRSWQSLCRGGVLQKLLLILVLMGAGAVLWREWEKHKRGLLKQEMPAVEGAITPVLRMTRSEDGTGIVVRVVRSNELPAILSNATPRELLPITNNSGSNASAKWVLTELSSRTEEYPRGATNVVEAQVALDHLLISPGCIDGVLGQQTRAALRVFQELKGIPPTGELIPETQQLLVLQAPAITTYAVDSSDFEHLSPVSSSWTGKARQHALEHETVLELLAERNHASERFLRSLNPGVQWDRRLEGKQVRVPQITPTATPGKAARLVISLSARHMRVFGGGSNLMAYFPCSIAQRVEKRPAGELKVISIAPDPNYTFDPKLFPESAEARNLSSKLLLPPGPNNPVGVAWIGLDKPGYGIHGTPHPEQVGRTESHGCFRLTNWNARRLLEMVWIGLPVQVVP